MNDKNKNLSRSIGRAAWLPCSQTIYTLRIIWENKIYVAYECVGRSMNVSNNVTQAMWFLMCVWEGKVGCMYMFWGGCMCMFWLNVWCTKICVSIYERVQEKIEKMRKRDDQWTSYYNFRYKIARKKIWKKKLHARSAFGLLYYYLFFLPFA